MGGIFASSYLEPEIQAYFDRLFADVTGLSRADRKRAKALRDARRRDDESREGRERGE